MLIDELEKKRAALQWSSHRFAQELGISHSTYSLIRRNRYHIGQKVLSAIMRRFPDLNEEVSLFLTNGVQIGKQTGDNSTPSPQAHHIGQGGGYLSRIVSIIKSRMGR